MRQPTEERPDLRVTRTAARSEYGLMPWVARMAAKTVGKRLQRLALNPKVACLIPR
jgi:hypothetical protein